MLVYSTGYNYHIVTNPVADECWCRYNIIKRNRLITQESLYNHLKGEKGKEVKGEGRLEERSTVENKERKRRNEEKKKGR